MDRLIHIPLPGSRERIDKALADAYPDLSRAQWQRLIKDGLVTVDGRPVKSSLRVDAPVTVTATLPPVADVDLVAEAIPLAVVYEDGDLLVVDKPAGMVVHPAAGHSSGTLVNAVLHHCPDIEGVGGEKRPGIVHRLDKDTSGLIVVAKNDRALRALQKQFSRRTVEKRYLALVEGHINPTEARIDAPIGRNPQQRKKMAVIPYGSSHAARDAQTTYRLRAFYDDFSLVDCEPHTGRTHQIRVHLAYIGYPIVGDTVYGRRKQRIRLARHFLHAAELTFTRPSDGSAVTLHAPLPADLQAILHQLEENEHR